jgi:hypothetical protein
MLGPPMPNLGSVGCRITKAVLFKAKTAKLASVIEPVRDDGSERLTDYAFFSIFSAAFSARP